MNAISSPIELLDALRAAALNERAAVEFFEAQRWGATPGCPRCGSVAVYTVKDAETGDRNEDHRWRCRDCKRFFTVRTGTVMEETRLPLRVWVHAFWRACASKKGVSALQIKRECAISYQSALFLMHRIRKAMGPIGPENPKFSGTIEADETYVGGKPRNKGPWNKRGKGSPKASVLGVVERDGGVRFLHATRVDGKTIRSFLMDNADTASRLITDEESLYRPAGREFMGGHHVTNHRRKEYVRGDVHSNTIESAFALLKRGVYGTFHSISKKHLHRYLGEFEFRWDNRKTDDAQRVANAIKAADGKRLTYRAQVDGEAVA